MKRALVVSGGGSKGAFAVGVLKEMFITYPHLDFDIYVGTSTGSLVVSLAAAGNMDILEKLYTTVSNKDIFIPGNIIDRVDDTSLFDVTPLWKLIQKNYSGADYDSLLRSAKKVFLNTVCLQTNALHVFASDANAIQPTNYKVFQTLNADHFRRAMLASACQPVFMPPIQVNRGVPGAANQDYQYVDGGVSTYIGVQMAIDAGATEIFAILLSVKESGEVNPQFTNLIGILGGTVDILTSEIGNNNLDATDQYNSALQYIEGVQRQMLVSGIAQNDIDSYFTLPGKNIFQNKKPVKIFKIRPDKPLGGGPGGLTFDPAEMKKMVAAGNMVFSDFAANLPPGDITWA